LDTNHIEPLPAPNVLAPHWVIAANHVALRLGKTRPVAVIGPSRQLRLLPSHDPVDLVLTLLATVRTGHYVRSLLCFFIEKIALFHATPHPVGSLLMPAASPSAILPDFTPRRQE
jgi:hypothetical protein